MAESLRARALAMLARREMSRAELRKKLEPLAQTAAELDVLLDSLSHDNLQSDRRFTEALVHHRAKRFGAARVAAELREKGIEPGLAEGAIDALRESEETRAFAVWRKKFAALPKSAEERAKQGRFLMGRGFSAEVAHRVLSGKVEKDLE